MGHSFGCIVVSSMLRGPGAGAALPRPVDSLVLVQGALSLWSFCPDIPIAPGQPGYFHDIVKNKKVSGPIVTTRSRFDTAVGQLYPIAAGIARQVDFAPGEFPTYGGVGTFGARGLDDRCRGRTDAGGKRQVHVQAGNDLQPREQPVHHERRRRLRRAQRHRRAGGRARVVAGRVDAVSGA